MGKNQKENFVTVTRKLKLELIKGDIENLRQISDDTFKAYNLITSNQYFNEIFEDRIILNDEGYQRTIKKKETQLENAKSHDKKSEIKILLKELKDIHKEIKYKSDKFWMTNKDNSTYDVIRAKLPKLPSAVVACINQEAVNLFKHDLWEIKNGLRSIRSFRKGCPIPFMKSSTKILDGEKNFIFKWIEGFEFKIILGNKDISAREIELRRVIDEEYQYCNSKIQFKKDDIFLLLCLKIPKVKNVLDENICAGVDLGLNTPAYITLKGSIKREKIGAKEDLFRFRIQFQERRRALQKQLQIINGGKGRDKKLKALNRLKEKEKNYVKTYNHQISRKIIDFCLRHQAGTLYMEKLKGFGNNYKKNNAVLRNWSYYQLQEMIKYKCKQAGVKCLEINPAYTSLTCNVCGNYDPKQRGSKGHIEEFTCSNKDCSNYNIKINADWNGALNIAAGGLTSEKLSEIKSLKKNET
jgi:IS605 OrfB family transposase